jgi:hypothetical protein
MKLVFLAPNAPAIVPQHYTGAGVLESLPKGAIDVGGWSIISIVIVLLRNCRAPLRTRDVCAPPRVCALLTHARLFFSNSR